MFQRRPNKFRRRSNGRHQMLRSDNVQTRLGSNSFENGKTRNNFRNFLSAEKLFEKYISLAKEATSSGDKTLSENYLQHADHFKRVIDEKNKNRNQNKVSVIDKPIQDNQNNKDKD